MAKLELGELAKLEKKLRKTRSIVPTPQSYLEQMRARREAAHKVSGFTRIQARFVPGGAPGSGKRS